MVKESIAERDKRKEEKAEKVEDDISSGLAILFSEKEEK